MTNVIKEFFCLSNGSSRACSKPVIPFKYKNNNSGQITSLFLYLPPSHSLSLASEDGVCTPLHWSDRERERETERQRQWERERKREKEKERKRKVGRERCCLVLESIDILV
jgi:hypothetical protein